MIRSSADPASKWRIVPRAFRISWGSADFEKFERPSWVESRLHAAGLWQAALILAIRDAISAFATGAGDRANQLSARAAASLMEALFMCVALAWGASDQLRRMRLRMKEIAESTKRLVGISQPKLLKRRWSVVFQVTVRRDMGFAPGLIAA